MLRLPSRKPPPASSRIRGSLTGEAAKSKSASAAGRRQPGGRHLVLDRARLLVGDLDLQQRTDDLLHRMAALEPVGEDIVVGGAHACELQRRHHRQHLMTLHDRPPQAVIALAIGHRLVTKLQALGRRDGCRRCRLALPGEDVEHDVARDARGAHDGTAGAAVERFGAGRLDRLQSVLQHGREHLDELPVAVVVAREPGSQAAERVGQLPALEGRAIAQRAGLPRQDRHVVPRIVGDLAAPDVDDGLDPRVFAVFGGV